MRFRTVIATIAGLLAVLAGSDAALGATLGDRVSVSAAQYGGGPIDPPGPGTPPDGGPGPGTPPNDGPGPGPGPTLTPPDTTTPTTPTPPDGTPPSEPTPVDEPIPEDGNVPDVNAPESTVAIPRPGGSQGLPLTGYAVIPLILGSLLLLAGGLVLRRIPRRRGL